jgi:hypothetical protein
LSQGPHSTILDKGVISHGQKRPRHGASTTGFPASWHWLAKPLHLTVRVIVPFPHRAEQADHGVEISHAFTFSTTVGNE